LIQHRLSLGRSKETLSATPMFCAVIVFALAGCGGGGTSTTTAPTDVKFGDTALVVVVNPVVNDANLRAVAAPGQMRANV
jgi:hypothetical protein